MLDQNNKKRKKEKQFRWTGLEPRILLQGKEYRHGPFLVRIGWFYIIGVGSIIFLCEFIRDSILRKRFLKNIG
jgi:hypothetical protein